ncbi:hypothetical protein [uncultured Haemophilus sp.]|uniref:hypothetical protein n=1 Tax=uncultured Haemophilus sp. TaxID=237779 RepID=UPI0025E6473E|nr:hypothetical protein [uncultured Haemophilus sp.]
MERLLSSLCDPNIAFSGWLTAILIAILGYFLNKSVKNFDSKTEKLIKEVESIERTIKSDSPSERIRKRFNEAISLLKMDNSGNITESTIGELIGLDSPNELDDILNGKKDLSYDLMKIFCDKIGINYHWISNGQGYPFFIEKEITDSPSYFISRMKNKFNEFYLIRSEDKHGSILVITKSENNIKYNIYPTTWLSNNPYLTKDKNNPFHGFNYYDNNDRKLIADLYQVLNKNLDSSNIKFHSMILSEDDFNKIKSGRIYVGKYINNRQAQKGTNWWRDFGDMSAPEEARRSYNDECIETHEEIKEYLNKSRSNDENNNY